MRFTVIALDTRGGVQPYAALTRGLADAGHQVTVATLAGLADLARSAGVNVAPVPGDPEAVTRGAGAAELSWRQRNRLMRASLLDHVAEQTTALLAACEGADAVVGGVGGQILGRPVAEKHGIPFLEAHLQPLGPPTSAFPGPLLPSVPRPLNRVSHRLTALALRMPFAAATRAARTDVLGLPATPPPPRAGLPVVYGYSPAVLPHPAEWGPERKVTGYWTLEPAQGWTPPAALEEFLNVGPPPVCIGFGSMSSADPQALTTLVLGAVRRVRARAVLLSGWGGLVADLAGTGGEVLVVEEAPHTWLYPRVAAVVHHGGAGTTGAALRAGVPAVVVPFAVDQPFWGARVAALGTGPTPVPRRGLTTQKLGDALTQALGDPTMRRRAAHLGQIIRAENGIHTAAEHLSRLRLPS